MFVCSVVTIKIKLHVLSRFKNVKYKKLYMFFIIHDCVVFLFLNYFFGLAVAYKLVVIEIFEPNVAYKSIYFLKIWTLRRMKFILNYYPNFSK